MKNESTRILEPLLLALVFMLALPAMAQQTTEQLPDHPGRFAPPPSVTCDGRYLESFNGPVTRYAATVFTPLAWQASATSSAYSAKITGSL